MAKTQRNKRGTFCGEGAVKQEGKLPIYDCLTCWAEVVWATSNRTGRKYLVNVRTGESGTRFYMKHDIHRCEDRMPAPEPTRDLTIEAKHMEVLQTLHKLDIDPEKIAEAAAYFGIPNPTL